MMSVPLASGKPLKPILKRGPVRKSVTFSATNPQVFFADDWDRSPIVVTPRFGYSDVLELKQLSLNSPSNHTSISLPPLLPYVPPLNMSQPSNTLPLPNSWIGRPIESTPPATPLEAPVTIGSRMTPAEIIQHLVLHGCEDLTSKLCLPSCSKYPIANGGFGDIYRGQLSGGLCVAIKCVRIFDPPDGGERQQKYLKHAAREIYTWSKLQHPHVLTLLGLAEYRDRISMVSPWIEGGTLRHHLARSPGPNRPQLCAQIADAVLYLHQSGVIHGDLKGDNVLVSDAGETLITDFGNAVLQECTLQFTSTTSGNQLSLRWTAPELFQGGLRSFEADIFALGMTILEAITGNLPYDEMSDIAVIFAIASCKLPKRPEAHVPSTSRYGDMLWSLLKNCWDSDPGMRPAVVVVRDKMRMISPSDLITQ